MRKSFNSNCMLILGALFITGCAGDESATQDLKPPEVRTWTVSVNAKGESVDHSIDDNMTRAVFYGGNNGHQYYFIWDKGDVVDVYKDNTKLGTLTPSSYGESSTTLVGSLTGSIAVNDVLTLYLPSRAYDYTGQDASMSKMSLGKAFQQSTTTVLESKEAGSTLSLSATRLNHAQGYWWLRLTDENGQRLHPTRLEIYSTSGKMVKTKSEDGVTTYFNESDPMVVDVAMSDDKGEYPGEAFLAIRNESGAADTYKFKLWVGEEIYMGPSDRALTYAISNGTMSNVKRKMKKTTPVSSLSVSSIANRTFTGYAQEPTGMTVRDGATTLTAGTDYAFEYSSNVNVGEATVVVRGLADAGATCVTKYLGTQDVHFNITKATPKIQMNTSTLEFDYGASSESRTVTRVYIDNNNNDTYEAAIDYDITSQCAVNYVSNNTGVCTVNTSGQVTPVGSGSTTITAQVYAAANWNSVSTYYPVTVVAGVRNANAVSNWSDGGSTPGKVDVE